MAARAKIALSDQARSQMEVRCLLKRLRDQGFGCSDENLAVALGRPVAEVQGWTTGSLTRVDAEVILKARGLALDRGFDIY